MTNPSGGIAQLQTFLRERGLSTPYLPDELKADIAPMGNDLFGAGECAEELVDVRSAATVAEGDSLPTSVVVGLGGRGMQSSTLLYRLAEEPVVLLVDLPWAEVYGNREDEIAEAGEAFADIDTLLTQVPTLLNAGERLIVTSSEQAGTSYLVYEIGSAVSVARSTSWVNVTGLGDVVAQLEA
jgi:hypothetical protein